MRFVEGFGVAQIQFGGLQVVLVIQPRHFVQNLNIDTFVRLQADGQLVLRQFLPGLFEQIQLWIFEIYHHFGTFRRQAFPGAQIERDTRPAPVIDIHANGNKGLGVAGLIRALFFQIARYFFTLRKACGVLPTNGLLTHVRAIDTAQRFQYFHFLITDIIR
ncbi:hypothetical protein D3C78_1466270 [compost metagenome]